MASALPLAVAIPIGGAVLAPLAGRISGRVAFATALTALAGSTGVLAWVTPTVFRGEILSHFLGNWRPIEGRALGIAFAADPFGMVFALAASGVGLLLVLYALSELSDLGGHELGNFACLFLLLVAGLIGAALTADLFNLFVWFEVSALASYALTGFFLERPLALEAAFKMLVLTTLASFAIFLGSALVYSDLGGLNLAQLQRSLDGVAPGPAAVVALGVLTILAVRFAPGGLAGVSRRLVTRPAPGPPALAGAVAGTGTAAGAGFAALEGFGGFDVLDDGDVDVDLAVEDDEEDLGGW